MRHITIYGITPGNRTLLLFDRINNQRTFYDFTQGKVIVTKGWNTKVFDEKSQFAEAVYELRKSKLGELLYRSARAGDKKTIHLERGSAEIGQKIPGEFLK